MPQVTLVNAQVDKTAIWLDLAEHFLDTETRHLIPASAGLCVRAGLSIEAAGNIWRYEVTPAVWPNLWSVAGEWGLWERDWLTSRIQALRGRFPNRPGAFAKLIYRLRVHYNHRVWVAIAACMEEFEHTPEFERQGLERNLGWLSRHYFDFCPTPVSAVDRVTLRSLYYTTFLRVFEPLVFRDRIDGESKVVCNARVEAALAAPPTAAAPELDLFQTGRRQLS